MFPRLFTRSVVVLSILFSLDSQVSAQFSRANLDSLRNQLRLLELTQADVVSILSPGSFTSHFLFANTESFYREEETVDVTYSTGKCELGSSEFMPEDAWNVPKGTLVSVEIQPKDSLTARDLGFDLGKLKKERPYRPSKNYVYFDKETGLSIHMWGDNTVHTIGFFPSRGLESRLCNNDAIRRYFRKDKWRFLSETKKQYAVDFNFPANVSSMSVNEVEPARFRIGVTASDPEYDVLTYKITGGRIIGMGAKVVWDLTGLLPGVYTITCDVGDGVGPRGRFLTKSVTLK
jgi:hypothetical protein